MENQLILGDCLEVMQNIPDASIDMIFTDLPFGKTKNHWDKEINLPALWKQYERIIKPNGAILLYGQGLFAFKLALSNEKLFRYELVWKKGERVSDFLNTQVKPLQNHELILVFYKKKPTYHPQFKEGKPLHSKGKTYQTKALVNHNYGDFKPMPDERKGSTQKYPKTVLDFEKPHPAIFPTQKSQALTEYLIQTYTNEGEIVLDSCAGSGTTGLACIATNRRYFLIEKDKQNYNLISQRIKNLNP